MQINVHWQKKDQWLSGKVGRKTEKEAQETFEGDGHVHYLNCDDFTGVIPGQNLSNYTL